MSTVPNASTACPKFSFSTTSRLIRILAAMAIATGSASTAAQVLEEVTVTAKKREQNIQDVGISITAFSGDQLRSLGFTDAFDIAAQTPGLNFDGGASGSVTKIPVIRGVSQNDFGTQQEPPVAVYVDNTYISSIAATGFTLFDVERVEVLKGPQGTLFGRNATGGLLHYLSAEPTEEFEAYFTQQIRDQNGTGFRSEGAISGALADGVRGRLSGFYEQSDGYWINNAPDSQDSFEIDGSFAVRGQLDVDLSEDLTLGLSVGHGDFSLSNQGTYTYTAGANDPVTGLGYVLTPENDPDAVNGACPGCDFFGQDGSESRPNDSSFNDVGFLERDFTTVTVDVNWLLGDGISLTSITNYQDFSFNYNEDCDGSVIDYCQFPFGQDLEQFSQELRVSGQTETVFWQAGLFYLDITQTAFSGFQSSAEEGFDFTVADVMNQDTKSYALFGSLEFSLSDNLSATVGLRWTEDEKSVDSDVYYGGGGPAIVDLIAILPNLVDQFSDTQEDSDWSGRLGLDYSLNDDSLWFASISRGNKAGGYVANLNGFPIGSEDRRFDPEVLTSFEAGFKQSNLFGGRARLNGSVFYYDYSDYQAFDFQGLAAFIRNRDATVSGGELELAASFNNGWDLLLGAAFLFDATVENVVIPGGQTVDRDMPKAPDFTFNGLLRKGWQLNSGSEFSAQVSFDYTDESFSSVSNAPATLLSSYTIVDARLAYAASDDSWELALFGKNIFDEDAQNFAFELASFGIHIQSWRPPRMLGAEVTFNF